MLVCYGSILKETFQKNAGSTTSYSVPPQLQQTVMLSEKPFSFKTVKSWFSGLFAHNEKDTDKNRNRSTAEAVEAEQRELRGLSDQQEKLAIELNKGLELSMYLNRP